MVPAPYVSFVQIQFLFECSPRIKESLTGNNTASMKLYSLIWLSNLFYWEQNYATPHTAQTDATRVFFYKDLPSGNDLPFKIVKSAYVPLFLIGCFCSRSHYQSHNVIYPCSETWSNSADSISVFEIGAYQLTALTNFFWHLNTSNPSSGSKYLMRLEVRKIVRSAVKTP